MARTRLGHGFGGLLTRVSRAVHYGRWGSVDNDATHVMGAAERVRARSLSMACPAIISSSPCGPLHAQVRGTRVLAGAKASVCGPSFHWPTARALRESDNGSATTAWHAVTVVARGVATNLLPQSRSRTRWP